MSENNNPSNGSSYKAESIRVIEGLDAVRKRPAMYIGSTGPQGLHHLVYEIVDNSVDEALGGHCDIIKVILHKDGACSVEDNGRGIPTGIHPTEKVSAAQVALTKLHAGGKFDKDSYKYSGGLHGVGVSVVNALSSKLELTIWQDGKTHTQSYVRGKPQGPLTVVGDTQKRGTLVRFIPDAEIFVETTKFSFETLSARLRELAFLNKKLRISIADEETGKINDFYFEGGIVSFVEHINAKKVPLFANIIYCEQADNDNILEVALQYNDGYGEQLFSFVNNINTLEGGTHVAGFKSALTKVCNKKATELNIAKGESFSSEDVREGLVCVINLKVPEPQFEGQTKTKLGNNDIKGIVDSWTFAFLDTYFEENPAIARKILQKAEIARQARDAARRARDLTRRKTALESSLLPGKLADCTNEEPEKTELFIVEGDSAGGSAKQGRDRNYQAILPLRGKILNVEKARLDKMLANEEIKSLIAAIGAGIGDEFEATKARYHKIILMTDADVDGSHIRTLLLTFFFRYMRPVIDQGYLYVAQPPLYKAKIGKKEQYLNDDKELKQFLFGWAQENTTITVNNKQYAPEAWQQLLTNLMAYDSFLEATSRTYKIAYEHCHQLIHFLFTSGWKNEDGVTSLLEKLTNYFRNYRITLEEHSSAIDIPGKERTILFSLLKKHWNVSLDFFSSSDVTAIYPLFKQLLFVDDTMWIVQGTTKDAMITNKGILHLLTAIVTISKPYLNIQRYKGLGEMNPEQLWETSMDANSRILLKVTIEDALQADEWFSTLMGDDVAGRKKYIEDYGHFVKHLDI